MDKPFFSIILPTYNRSHFLPVSVKSVLAQTFVEWELIIVDDGSKDDTKKVVQGFNDDRIRYINQTNSGVSTARNVGIKESRGKYICFIDDDDQYLESHLSFLNNYIRKNNSPVKLISTNLFFRKNDTLIKKEYENYGNTNSFSILPYPSSACIHSKILVRHQFNSDLYMREDHELFDRIRNDYGIISLNEYTVVLTKHDENISGNPYKVHKGLEKTTYHYIKDRRKIGFYELVQLHNSYLYLLIHHVRSGEIGNTIQYLAKYTLVLPFVLFRKRVLKSYLRIANKILNKNPA